MQLRWNTEKCSIHQQPNKNTDPNNYDAQLKHLVTKIDNTDIEKKLWAIWFLSDSILRLKLLDPLVELIHLDDEPRDGVEQPVEDERGRDQKRVTLRFHDRFLVAEVLRWGTRIRLTGGAVLVLPVDIHQQEEAKGNDREEGFEETPGHGN